MIRQGIVNNIRDTIFVKAKIKILGISQGLDLILHSHIVLDGMALYPVVVITSSIGIIPMGIWRFHGDKWNTSNQLTLDKSRQQFDI